MDKCFSPFKNSGNIVCGKEYYSRLRSLFGADNRNRRYAYKYFVNHFSALLAPLDEYLCNVVVIGHGILAVVIFPEQGDQEIEALHWCTPIMRSNICRRPDLRYATAKR